MNHLKDAENGWLLHNLYYTLYTLKHWAPDLVFTHDLLHHNYWIATDFQQLGSIMDEMVISRDVLGSVDTYLSYSDWHLLDFRCANDRIILKPNAA